MNLFIPGRICLLGEHSDWAGGYRSQNSNIEKGYAIICGTNQGIYAEVEPHPTALVLSSTKPDGSHIGPHEILMKPKNLLVEAQKGGFWSYIAGVTYQISQKYTVQGITLHNHHTDLPIRKGLSSSAAICVLVARAFNQLYNLGLTIRDEMELAYQGEITTPSRCGRMDQGCAFGNRPVLMIFDGDNLQTKELKVKTDLFFVIVDLQSTKNTLKILKHLNDCFPYAQTSREIGLHELLGDVNKRIIHEAIEAIEVGDGAGLGALMINAQKDFDKLAAPLCPEELTAPILHKVLAYPPLEPYIWGGKGVGSQGDGSCQLLARSAEAQSQIIRIIEEDLHLPCLELTIKADSER